MSTWQAFTKRLSTMKNKTTNTVLVCEVEKFENDDEKLETAAGVM